MGTDPNTGYAGKGGGKTRQPTLLLVQEPESALAAMFSGNNELELDNGAVVIDREKYGFMIMMNYLKNKNRVFEFTDEELKVLEEELEFWQMSMPYNVTQKFKDLQQIFKT